MCNEVAFKNRDRFIQLGIAISTLRKKLGMSQEQLAKNAAMRHSQLSAIEVRGNACPFSLEVFYNIADALEVDPADLIYVSVFPEQVLKNT